MARGTEAAGAGGDGGVPTVPITKFAFADDDAVVKIYVDVPAGLADDGGGGGGLAALSDDALHTSVPSPRAFELRIAGRGAVHVLAKGNLSGPIAGAAAKKGKTRIVVTLTKAEPGPWAALTAAAAGPMGTDDE